METGDDKEFLESIHNARVAYEAYKEGRKIPQPQPMSAVRPGQIIMNLDTEEKSNNE